MITTCSTFCFRDDNDEFFSSLINLRSYRVDLDVVVRHADHVYCELLLHPLMAREFSFPWCFGLLFTLVVRPNCHLIVTISTLVVKKLLSEILPGQRLVVSSVDRGINLMQDRLCRKKVLLVLDDVNDIEQLNALAGEQEWFGEGSRINITTRDKHLLTSHRIEEDHIYEVKPLECRDALELLNRHAFLRNNKIIIRRHLVDRALQYADGLPLALKVLGYFLCCRIEREWESTLHNLANIPNKIINDALIWSYDGLEDYVKEIFLDIACFFKGQSKEYIMKVLDSYNCDPLIGVQVLVEKSLMIEEKETLQMRNLIQLMAMDIVKQECPHDPGRRSRLWRFDDFRNVLSMHMVTNALESIVLKLPKPEKINIGPNALTNMRRLKKLIMINVHNSFQGPIYLPDELRWFEWRECRPCIPASSSGLENSARLDLPESNVQALRKQFKDFKKSESNNFSECPSLVSLPIILNPTRLDALVTYRLRMAQLEQALPGKPPRLLQPKKILSI